MFFTDTDTPGAVDAKVVVPVEEGIVFFNIEIVEVNGEFNGLDLEVGHDARQFTVTILGTPATAGGDADFTDGFHGPGTFFFFPADEAAGRVFAEDELNDLPPHVLDKIGFGGNFHPFPDGGGAGGGVAAHPVDLNDA